MSDFELNRELREFNKEQGLYELELSNYRNKIADELRNEMGRDMKDVLEGKVKIKLSFYKKLNTLSSIGLIYFLKHFK